MTILTKNVSSSLFTYIQCLLVLNNCYLLFCVVKLVTSNTGYLVFVFSLAIE